MKNEKENKLTEEWVTPSVNVMDVNEKTEGGLNNSSDGLDIGTLS
jgi:hypothetical protein